MNDHCRKFDLELTLLNKIGIVVVCREVRWCEGVDKLRVTNAQISWEWCSASPLIQ